MTRFYLRVEERRRNIRISRNLAIILLIFVLIIVSYASWGFVGILALVAQWFVSTPLITRFSGIILMLSIILLIICRILSRKEFFKTGLIKSVGGVLLGLSILGLIVGGLVSLEKTPYHIRVEELDEPIGVFGVYRFIPMRTAYANAISMLQIPTHTLYFRDSYVYFANGSLVYNWIIEPEGFWNEVTKGPRGVVFVNAGIYPPQVKIIYRNMTWGLHNFKIMPGYVDGLYREAQLVAGLDKRLLLEDNIEVVWNKHVYILIPAVTWVTGIDYSLPTLAGYVVVDENGSMRWLTVDQARNNPLFKGVPLLPEVVAREWIEAYRWIYGIGNVLIYRNTFQIRDIGTNPQPYLVLDDRGNLWWVFVAEPPGETYSAKYIFYINASDIEPHILAYELPEPMIGVSKVEAYVKQRYPTYDWSQLSIEEPIPTIINKTLYWKVSVTTSDGRGLVTVCLVNAKTGEADCIQPRGKVTYMDIIGMLLNKTTVKPNVTGNMTLIQQVRALKEKVGNLIKELETIYRELEAIEEQLNKTNNK